MGWTMLLIIGLIILVGTIIYQYLTGENIGNSIANGFLYHLFLGYV